MSKINQNPRISFNNSSDVSFAGFVVRDGDKHYIDCGKGNFIPLREDEQYEDGEFVVVNDIIDEPSREYENRIDAFKESIDIIHRFIRDDSYELSLFLNDTMNSDLVRELPAPGKENFVLLYAPNIPFCFSVNKAFLNGESVAMLLAGEPIICTRTQSDVDPQRLYPGSSYIIPVIPKDATPKNLEVGKCYDVYVNNVDFKERYVHVVCGGNKGIINDVDGTKLKRGDHLKGKLIKVLEKKLTFTRGTLTLSDTDIQEGDELTGVFVTGINLGNEKEYGSKLQVFVSYEGIPGIIDTRGVSGLSARILNQEIHKWQELTLKVIGTDREKNRLTFSLIDKSIHYPLKEGDVLSCSIDMRYQKYFKWMVQKNLVIAWITLQIDGRDYVIEFNDKREIDNYLASYVKKHSITTRIRIARISELGDPIVELRSFMESERLAIPRGTDISASIIDEYEGGIIWASTTLYGSCPFNAKELGLKIGDAIMLKAVGGGRFQLKDEDQQNVLLPIGEQISYNFKKESNTIYSAETPSGKAIFQHIRAIEANIPPYVIEYLFSRDCVSTAIVTGHHENTNLIKFITTPPVWGKAVPSLLPKQRVNVKVVCFTDKLNLIVKYEGENGEFLGVINKNDIDYCSSNALVPSDFPTGRELECEVFKFYKNPLQLLFNRRNILANPFDNCELLKGQEVKCKVLSVSDNGYIIVQVGDNPDLRALVKPSYVDWSVLPSGKSRYNVGDAFDGVFGGISDQIIEKKHNSSDGEKQFVTKQTWKCVKIRHANKDNIWKSKPLTQGETYNVRIERVDDKDVMVSYSGYFGEIPTSDFVTLNKDIIIGNCIDACLKVYDEASQHVAFSLIGMSDDPWEQVDTLMGQTLNAKIIKISEQTLELEYNSYAILLTKNARKTFQESEIASWSEGCSIPVLIQGYNREKRVLYGGSPSVPYLPLINQTKCGVIEKREDNYYYVIIDGVYRGLLFFDDAEWNPHYKLYENDTQIDKLFIKGFDAENYRLVLSGQIGEDPWTKAKVYSGTKISARYVGEYDASTPIMEWNNLRFTISHKDAAVLAEKPWLEEVYVSNALSKNKDYSFKVEQIDRDARLLSVTPFFSASENFYKGSVTKATVLQTTIDGVYLKTLEGTNSVLVFVNKSELLFGPVYTARDFFKVNDEISIIGLFDVSPNRGVYFASYKKQLTRPNIHLIEGEKVSLSLYRIISGADGALEVLYNNDLRAQIPVQETTWNPSYHLGRAIKLEGKYKDYIGKILDEYAWVKKGGNEDSISFTLLDPHKNPWKFHQLREGEIWTATWRKTIDDNQVVVSCRGMFVLVHGVQPDVKKSRMVIRIETVDEDNRMIIASFIRALPEDWDEKTMGLGAIEKAVYLSELPNGTIQANFNGYDAIVPAEELSWDSSQMHLNINPGELFRVKVIGIDYESMKYSLSIRQSYGARPDIVPFGVGDRWDLKVTRIYSPLLDGIQESWLEVVPFDCIGFKGAIRQNDLAWIPEERVVENFYVNQHIEAVITWIDYRSMTFEASIRDLSPDTRTLNDIMVHELIDVKLGELKKKNDLWTVEFQYGQYDGRLFLDSKYWSMVSRPEDFFALGRKIEVEVQNKFATKRKKSDVNIFAGFKKGTFCFSKDYESFLRNSIEPVNVLFVAEDYLYVDFHGLVVRISSEQLFWERGVVLNSIFSVGEPILVHVTIDESTACDIVTLESKSLKDNPFVEPRLIEGTIVTGIVYAITKDSYHIDVDGTYCILPFNEFLYDVHQSYSVGKRVDSVVKMLDSEHGHIVLTRNNAQFVNEETCFHVGTYLWFTVDDYDRDGICLVYNEYPAHLNWNDALLGDIYDINDMYPRGCECYLKIIGTNKGRINVAASYDLYKGKINKTTMFPAEICLKAPSMGIILKSIADDEVFMLASIRKNFSRQSASEMYSYSTHGRIERASEIIFRDGELPEVRIRKWTNGFINSINVGDIVDCRCAYRSGRYSLLAVDNPEQYADKKSENHALNSERGLFVITKTEYLPNDGRAVFPVRITSKPREQFTRMMGSYMAVSSDPNLDLPVGTLVRGTVVGCLSGQKRDAKAKIRVDIRGKGCMEGYVEDVMANSVYLGQDLQVYVSRHNYEQRILAFSRKQPRVDFPTEGMIMSCSVVKVEGKDIRVDAHYGTRYLENLSAPLKFMFWNSELVKPDYIHVGDRFKAAVAYSEHPQLSRRCLLPDHRYTRKIYTRGRILSHNLENKSCIMDIEGTIGVMPFAEFSYQYCYLWQQKFPIGSVIDIKIDGTADDGLLLVSHRKVSKTERIINEFKPKSKYDYSAEVIRSSEEGVVAQLLGSVIEVFIPINRLQCLKEALNDESVFIPPKGFRLNIQINTKIGRPEGRLAFDGFVSPK